MLDADLVIHDSQYTPEEYPAKRNWGHSTFEYAVAMASAAGVKRLALMHHDPLHSDEAMDVIEQRGKDAARQFGTELEVFCAKEGDDLQVVAHAGGEKARIAPHGGSIRVGGRRSVLVVDDDSNIHLLAETALAKDYTLTEAEDGEQCLEAIRTAVPDMVVLDLNMPRMDGLTVLRTVRNEMGLKDLPVLVLTASGDEGSTRAAFEAGATDYLIKPFTIPQLTTRVSNCFARAGWTGAGADHKG